MTDPRLRGRYVVRISPADVGRRVSVRSRIAEQQAPSAFTFDDTLGTLESWAAGVLAIRRRDGSLVEVAESALVAGKVVPPAPPPRARR